jgi:hypothetical protein
MSQLPPLCVIAYLTQFPLPAPTAPTLATHDTSVDVLPLRLIVRALAVDPVKLAGNTCTVADDPLTVKQFSPGKVYGAVSPRLCVRVAVDVPAVIVAGPNRLPVVPALAHVPEIHAHS